MEAQADLPEDQLQALKADSTNIFLPTLFATGSRLLFLVDHLLVGSLIFSQFPVLLLLRMFNSENEGFFFFISTPKLSRGFLFSSLWCLGSTFTASQLNKEVIIQGTLVSDLLWVRSLRRDWANRQGSLFFNYHFRKIRTFYLLILRIYSSMNKTSWGQGQTFACFCVRTFFRVPGT